MLGGAQNDPVSTTGGKVQLGKYQLLRRLATGGMAELFLARAQAIHGFEKLVVLKRILPQHAESEDFIRMFLAEARLAATLHHPNIVQVYDIGEEGSMYFFTMEYVQGQDLRKLVRAARKASVALPLEHILHIVMGAAAGLNHAHEKIGHDGQPLGIVHRDVSPSNVLVTYEGGVKIVDFGIAKAATAQTATIAGTLKGKIPYMSPEQCRGEVVDCRSDIFSIGTLLWELTTGVRLFTGENEFSIINRVAAGDVPAPSTVRPDYPPELEAIVMRALHADRDMRYATAQDLQIDLEDFAREARLPVSSTRMAKFMRELFREEIERDAQQLQADRIDDQPTAPRPSITREVLTAVGVRSGDPPTVDPESAEVTPSEIRADQIMATPGPADTGFGTDVHFEESPSNRKGVVLAMLTGTLAMLGVATAGWWFFLPGHAAKSEAPSDERTPAVIVEIPAVPEPPPAVEEPPPAADPPRAEERKTAAERSSKPSESNDKDGKSKQFPADGDAAPPEPAPAPKPSTKNDKTGRKGDSAKRGSSRRGGSKRHGSNKGSPGGNSKKWDPDSADPF